MDTNIIGVESIFMGENLPSLKREALLFDQIALFDPITSYLGSFGSVSSAMAFGLLLADLYPGEEENKLEKMQSYELYIADLHKEGVLVEPHWGIDFQRMKSLLDEAELTEPSKFQNWFRENTFIDRWISKQGGHIRRLATDPSVARMRLFQTLLNAMTEEWSRRAAIFMRLFEQQIAYPLLDRALRHRVKIS